MRIGEVSEQSQLSRDTVRYYEKLGLLNTPKRQGLDNHYKNYPPEALLRLQQIQLLKRCGFTLREIKHLFNNHAQAETCRELPQRLTEKISSIDSKIRELQSFKSALLQIQQSCSEACGSSTGLPDCIHMGNQFLT